MTVSQTAVILAVTRHYSSTLLNFAAHSPEDANATENTVLRTFDGPDHRDRSSTDRRIPRAMSDQDRQHSVTNADLRRGARSPNPGAVRLAGHMGGRGQRRQALQSIRPDGVTLEGVGSLRSPPIAPPYRWTGEPRCIAACREPRVFPSAEASTWC